MSDQSFMRGCFAKTKYYTYKDAERSLRKSIRYAKTDDRVMNIYRCRHCQNFHIGHGRPNQISQPMKVIT